VLISASQQENMWSPASSTEDSDTKKPRHWLIISAKIKYWLESWRCNSDHKAAPEILL